MQSKRKQRAVSQRKPRTNPELTRVAPRPSTGRPFGVNQAEDNHRPRPHAPPLEEASRTAPDGAEAPGTDRRPAPGAARSFGLVSPAAASRHGHPSELDGYTNAAGASRQPPTDRTALRAGTCPSLGRNASRNVPRVQAVIFCGIQASGKTTFYKERFADTHVRISLDMLRTRRRESLLLAACLEGRQAFVVDNTNVTRADRARYTGPALRAGFEVIAYFFDADPRRAFERNVGRPGKAAVPPAALFGARRRLEPPSRNEGFHAVYTVRIPETGGFEVEPGPHRRPK